MKTRFRARRMLLALSTVLACGTAAPAFAQSATYRNLDANGVDLTLGDFVMAFPEGAVGSGKAELALVRTGAGGMASQWDNYSFKLVRSSNNVTITISKPDRRSDTFTGGYLQTSYTSSAGNGASLTKQTSDGSFVYRMADGTTVTFVNPNYDLDPPDSYYCNLSSPQSGCVMTPQTVVAADGRSVTLGFDAPANGNAPKLLTVTNNYGYSLAFSYSGYNRTRTDFQRNGVTVASVSYAYPSVGTVDITDMAGKIWRITNTSITRPGESSPSFSVGGTASAVTSVTRDGVTTNYARNASTGTMIVTDAAGKTTTVVSNLTVKRPTSVTDAFGKTTNYTLDSAGRVTRVTMPEGNYVNYTLDGRGNVTLARSVAKAGSGLPDIVNSAAYDGTCSNALTCNQPSTSTNGRQAVTNYSYDAANGQVTSIKQPAPATGGVRPEQRFGYTLVNGVYEATSISQCRVGAAPSCVGTDDETITAIARDSFGNVTSMTNKAGSNSLVATTTATYDAKGNILTVDGPLAGDADTTTYRYDAARRVVGTISPDPDGTGSLKRRAVRTTYDDAGRTTLVENGTVNGTSDSDWAAFNPAQGVATTWVNGRKASERLYSGTTSYALTQYGYDTLGRIECVTQRMNPATFGSLPAACTLGTAGANGDDRITRYTYDDAGRQKTVTTGYGTPSAAVEKTLAFTDNGQVQSVVDAENNKTSYGYDGFDRLAVTTFPSVTKGAGTSNAADFEQLGYDANGNVTSRRLRDSTNIAFTYDDLDRVTLKNLPGSEPDVTYSYDNAGRVTSASQAGNNLSFTYDPLGRNLTQVGPLGTVTSQWDLAGRRTQLTYPGTGLYVTYDYLVTGEMTKLRENGATSGAGVLATIAYDDIGRRTSLTRGNGTVTSYGFDPVSRLAALGQDLANTANDQSSTFTYNYAGQISAVTRNNDTYAWTGHGSGTTTSVANGLNQLASVGGSATAHDARGNLTTDPTTGKTYTYSSENLLTGSSGGTAATLGYDPAMRLYQVSGTTTTRFAYDGDAMLAEYDGNNGLQRRYVHGPGTDEPLVQYEGTSTNDRRWLHTDERGSVIATTGADGNAITTNRYDEYGKPQATNTGRFQYTGQMWLPDIAQYYYKARMYAPNLGRFMQPDPIEYDGGLNLYNYVSSDPVNRTDPSGTQCQLVQNYLYKTENGRVVSKEAIGNPYWSGDCSNSVEKANAAGQGWGLVAGKPKSKKQKSRHCYGPPRGPSGISMADLVAQTRQNGDQAASHSATDLDWFKSQVQNKGPWDYKQHGDSFQDYGNYNYGYTGARQGIPAAVLRLGAGYAQVRAGTWRLAYITSLFDDPRDQEQISRGISDAQNKCF